MKQIRAVVMHYVRRMGFRVTERWYDWRLGIVTDAMRKRKDVAVHNTECHDYSATSYRRFKQVLSSAGINVDDEVFVDFGSGMGRAVIMAAMYPFRKVIGVELSPELNAIAQANVDRVRDRLECQNVKLHTADARQFTVPDDATIFYFWSPFSKEILKQVLANIYRSIQQVPRNIHILYCHPPGLSCIEGLSEQLPWLDASEEVVLGTGMNLVHYTVRESDMNASMVSTPPLRPVVRV